MITKMIDHFREYAAIQNTLQKLSKFDNIERFSPKDAIVLNVSPDYSSTIAMHVAHHLSQDGEMLPIASVDVPYPGELSSFYKQEFYMLMQHLRYTKKKFILVEAAVLTGKNYTWMLEMMQQFEIHPNNILTVALFEKFDSIYKCDVVGELFYDDMVEFYYERYNKHWD